MSQYVSGVWLNKRALLSLNVNAPFDLESRNGDWTLRFTGAGEVQVNEERSGRTHRLPVREAMQLRSGGEELFLAWTEAPPSAPSSPGKADEKGGKR